MEFFEKKYGIKEDERVRTFHRSRRMFCIHQNKLFIAEPSLPYSHAVWFEKEGWISKENDKLMDKIVRGIIDEFGDIYFYGGYDFNINNEIERIFFNHLNEIVKQLKLKATARIFGGLIKQESCSKWPSRKNYGQIKDNLYLE